MLLSNEKFEEYVLLQNETVNVYSVNLQKLVVFFEEYWIVWGCACLWMGFLVYLGGSCDVPAG